MKRMTKEEFVKEASTKHKNRYDYSLVDYKNNITKVKIICRDHGIFEQSPKSHKLGQGCPKCNGVRIIDTNQFIQDAKSVHGDTYDYSLVEYKNNNTKIKITCKKHGVFEQTPSNHVNDHGCPVCANNIKLTTEQFIERCRKTHGDFYDYSLVEYEGSLSKVKIICPIHGRFEQYAISHSQGSKCINCAGLELKTTDQFIQDAKLVHGNTYDYSLVDYKGNKSLIKIICSKHGVFEQTPNNHLRGQSCLQCYHESKILTQEEFLQRCIQIHGNKYSYDKTIYTRNDNLIVITCKKHGDFIQTASSHIYSCCGCPLCLESMGEKKNKKILTK